MWPAPLHRHDRRLFGGPAWCVGLRLFLPHCPVVVLLGGAIFFSICPGLVSRGPRAWDRARAVCRAAIVASDRCAGCHGCTEDRAPTTQPHASAPATRRPVTWVPLLEMYPQLPVGPPDYFTGSSSLPGQAKAKC